MRPAPLSATVRAGTLEVGSGRRARDADLDMAWSGWIGPSDGSETAAEPALLAAAYRRSGHRAGACLTGEFVAVVADRRRGRSVVAADPLGSRALYHREDDGEVRVAAEIVDLVRERRPPLDMEYVRELLVAGRCRPPRTPFAGVNRLKPGHTLEVDARGCHERRQWRPRPHSEPSGALDAAFAELDRLLDEAVAATTAGATRVWTELSGGLDTATVAAAGRSGGRLDGALTVCYPVSSTVDESRRAGAVARHLGLEHHCIDGDRSPPFGRPPAELLGEPTPTIGLPVLYDDYPRVLGAAGVEVLLSGEGGDEIFSWTPVNALWAAELLRQGRPGAAWAELSTHAAGRHRLPATLLWPRCGRPLWRRARGRSIAPDPCAATPPWLDPAWAQDQVADADDSPAAGVDSVVRQRAWEHLLDSYALTAPDIAAGRLDLRHPLRYRPLVEHLLDRMLIHPELRGDTNRSVQRRWLDGRVPASAIGATKTDFAESFARAFRPGRPWYDTVAKESILVDLGLVEPDRWREAIRLAGLGVVDHIMAFRAAAVLEIWLRLYDEWRLPPRSPR